MKSVFTHITLLLLLLCAACTEQQLLPGGGEPLPAGQYRFTVTIPEPRVAATRTLGDRPQGVTEMPMHVLVFDENGFFIAFQQATVDSFDDETQTGTYTVSLPPSGGEKRTLHFVLGDVDFDTDHYLPTSSEADVMRPLTVSGGTDAYWQRVVLVNGIGNTAEDTDIPLVSLVRNFAKIVVENNAGQDNFTLQGFVVVNATNAGTVAPYTGTENRNGGFADYVSLNVPDGTDAYAAFATLNHGFGGNTVWGTDDGTATLPDASEYTTGAKYVYERNQDDEPNPACILLRGTYDGQTYYYKLDIVRTDEETWITSYLNLYRNFQYTIRINNVRSEGYATAEEAMQAAAANNIGASVEVSEVNTIQDGHDQLWVSTLDTLLVTSDVAEIRYEFRTGIDGGREGTVENDRVVITPVYDGQQVLNLDAVRSYDYTSEPGVLKITPATLPGWIEEQEFVVAVRNSGLMRRIRVRVRQPYNFMAVDCDDLVPEQAGSRVTLAVRLPQNMPPSVFPLVLDIEPLRKTLSPDATVNRLPVSTDKEHTFSYRATVTWDDYRDNYTQYFMFLTNVDVSQTYITVTNPYFVNESLGFDYVWDVHRPDSEIPRNVARFRNDERYNFFDVTLSSPGNGNFTATPDEVNKGTFAFNDYNPNGKELTLAFKMHREGDDFEFNPDTPHEPVEIYIDYIDYSLAQPCISPTGTIVAEPDRHRILYTPNNTWENLIGEQRITFTINTDYAIETIQMSSYDHETALVTYLPRQCRVHFQYYHYEGTWPFGRYVTENVPDNRIIEIYDNPYYSGEAIGECTVNNGEAVINLVEYDPDQTLYFRYSESGWNGNDYDGNMDVSQLPGSTILLR